SLFVVPAQLPQELRTQQPPQARRHQRVPAGLAGLAGRCQHCFEAHRRPPRSGAPTRSTAARSRSGEGCKYTWVLLHATCPRSRWTSSIAAQAATMLLAKAWRSACGCTVCSRPARRDNRTSNSLTAPGFIGAPTGGRRRLTSTKSLSSPRTRADRSTTYWSKAWTSRKSTGTTRARRDLAQAPLVL